MAVSARLAHRGLWWSSNVNGVRLWNRLWTNINRWVWFHSNTHDKKKFLSCIHFSSLGFNGVRLRIEFSLLTKSSLELLVWSLYLFLFVRLWAFQWNYSSHSLAWVSVSSLIIWSIHVYGRYACRIVVYYCYTILLDIGLHYSYYLYMYMMCVLAAWLALGSICSIFILYDCSLSGPSLEEWRVLF